MKPQINTDEHRFSGSVFVFIDDKIARVYAYVDSDATYSVFSADEAEKLDIAMETGQERYLITGDGG